MTNKNLKNKEEFSQEEHNLEIVKKDDVNKSKEVLIQEEVMDGMKKKKNIIIGTLNIFSQPVKDRHEKHYKESTFHLVADIVLASIVLILAGFIVWILFFRSIPSDVILESSYTSPKVTSGQIETFELQYDNKSDERISDVSISVRFPDNFIFNNTVPADIFEQNTNTFNIGSLSSGANGKVKISGLVLGSIDTQERITFTFNYKNSSKKAHNVLNTLHFNIEDSVLRTDLDKPKEIYQNVSFSGKIKLNNSGSDKLYDVEVVYPDGWNIEKSYCSIDNLAQSGNSWFVDSMAPGEDVVIEFTSKSEYDQGEYPFVFESRLLQNNESYLQKRIEESIEIKKLDFNVSLIPQEKSIKAGEKIKYTLGYSNKTDQDLKNIKFQLKSKDNDFNLNDIELSGNHDICQLNKDVVSIDELLVGQSGEISFYSNFIRQRIKTNQTVGLKVLINYSIDNQSPSYEIISDSVRIVSNLKVKSAAYYYSEQGDQLGVGPLPPVVDMPTSYWVFWEIVNYGNDLKDFAINAQLSDGVVWTGNKSLLSGKLLHGEIGGRVNWDVSEVSKEGGNYKVGFEVAVVPGVFDVGKIMNLLIDIKYGAYDEFSGELINGQADSITTNLKFDKLTTGKDKVVQ
jgi:hypothetical protein